MVDNLDIFRTNIQGITPICEYAIIFKPHLLESEIFYQRISSTTTVDGILDNVYSKSILKSNPFMYISIIINLYFLIFPHHLSLQFSLHS